MKDVYCIVEDPDQAGSGSGWIRVILPDFDPLMVKLVFKRCFSDFESLIKIWNNYKVEQIFQIIEVILINLVKCFVQAKIRIKLYEFTLLVSKNFPMTETVSLL